MRTLLAACAMGLQDLFKMVVDDPSSSLYDLGGFKRLNKPMLRYAVVAALSSRPLESLMVELLEDDRAVRDIQVLEESVRDELEWLAGIDGGVWLLLQSLLDSGDSGLVAKRLHRCS